MFFSDYYNKEVLAIDTAKSLGIVKGIYIDASNKKPKAVMVQKDNDGFFLAFRQIIGNNEKVTVSTADSLTKIDDKNIQELLYLDQFVIAYTHEGKYLGNFMDINISNDKLVWFDKPYPSRNISNVDKNILIINLGARKSRKKTNTQKDKESSKSSTPPSLTTTPPPSHTTTSPSHATSPSQTTSPSHTATSPSHTTYKNNIPPDIIPSPYVPAEKELNDYSFLNGRIVIRDIVDASCGVSIKKGTVINNSIIELAKKSGNLVFLALSSLLD